MNAIVMDAEAATLRDQDVADFLGISKQTIRAWRQRGMGPPYVRIGSAIRYRRSQLVAWARQRTVDPEVSR